MRAPVIVAVALACLPAGEAFGVAQPALLRYAGQAAAPLGPGFRRARPAVQVQFRDTPDENAVRSGGDLRFSAPTRRTTARCAGVYM